MGTIVGVTAEAGLLDERGEVPGINRVLFIDGLAAAPALVVAGFLMLTQIRDIPWDDWSIAIPGYLAIALMPLTYSITDGIGAAVVAFVAIRLVLGRLRELHPLMILVALLFAAYFAISPIGQWLGVR
jgi:adenine/guanine/hypoxanthine permease